MNSQSHVTTARQTGKAVAPSLIKKQECKEGALQFQDSRPKTVEHHKIQQMVNHSSQVRQLNTLQEMTNNSRGVPSSEISQFKPYVFKDETGAKDMANIADTLSSAVDTAKSIVDANPLLKGVEGNGAGYLGAWVTTFQEYLDSGAVPDFFYARYGYAIETLATGIFKANKFGKYSILDQVTYGATRPDFVIRFKETDIAWLDITSEGSPGHIFNKQGGGWTTKPFVAEIRYNMPSPDDFSKTASGKLNEQQIKALKSASSARAKQAATLARGRDFMAPVLANALNDAYLKKDDGLSKTEVQSIIRDTCRLHLNTFVDKPVTPFQAFGVLSNIEFIEIGENKASGESWAKWAYGKVGDKITGKVLLGKLGGF